MSWFSEGLRLISIIGAAVPTGIGVGIAIPLGNDIYKVLIRDRFKKWLVNFRKHNSRIHFKAKRIIKKNIK